MPFRRRTVTALLLPLILPAFARSQESVPPSSSPAESVHQYENSTDGLRLQLQDIVVAARDHNRPALEVLIKQVEIPNYEEWFTKTYGRDIGERRAASYGRELSQNEKDWLSNFLGAEGEGRKLEIRKVNGAPNGGMETAMIGELQRPTDIFYAGWSALPSDAPFNSSLIGYFVFLDGRFRWDSTIMGLKVRAAGSASGAPSDEASPAQTGGESQASAGTSGANGPYRPGVRGVTYPACTFCPDPGYTREARAKHIEGTVVLKVTITAEGWATDIVIVKTLDPGLTQQAVEAVKKWRFRPAQNEDKQPVPVIVPIEITFRLLN